jgi:hypothetical protein
MPPMNITSSLQTVMPVPGIINNNACHTDSEAEDSDIEDMGPKEAIQEQKALIVVRTMADWRRVQEFWSAALHLVSAKLQYMKSHNFEAFVCRMNDRMLKVCMNALLIRLLLRLIPYRLPLSTPSRALAKSLMLSRLKSNLPRKDRVSSHSILYSK